NGKPVDVASAEWALVGTGEHERSVVSPGSGTPDGRRAVKGQYATYAAAITNDGKPALELTRTFTVFPKAAAGEGYEVGVDYGVRNVSGSELTVAQTINGPTLPPREASRPPDRQVVAGFWAPDKTIVIDSPHPVESFAAGKATVDLTKDKENRPVAWAGASSVYFDAYVMFEQPAEVAKVAAEGKEFDVQPNAELRPVLLTVETTAAKLAAGETKTTSMSAFFGPRWRKVLNVPHFAAAPRDYDQTLIVKSGPCGFCAFDWLIASLVWLLNSFQYLAGGFAGAGDWGIAIILLVALVRTCLHPITKRSQMQMMKMGKMGPELAKLKDKYGDDKEAYTKAQMEVMKSQGIGPLLGCLPMFLQMPIWIALWQALQSTFELRQAPFLWGFTWIKDLSKPDYLVQFGRDIPLFFGLHLDGVNLLPILMSGVFYVQMTIQQRLQPPPATPEAASQQKMMKYMSTFLFPLFLYNGPSGLNLYILTSTLVGIIESKIIRDHIKQREAAEKLAGPAVIDAPVVRAGGKRGGPAAAAAKPTGLLGFLQKMQDRVEEVRKDKDQRGNGKGR
ncbi:MAG: yidC, partial [Phycisphaerales bacterium]|nr:yidC [Phycisphaerales bacterium]